jgi:hypothetical protein
MLGRAVAHKKIREHLEDFVAFHRSRDLDRQTLPRVLVEHRAGSAYYMPEFIRGLASKKEATNDHRYSQ